MTFDEFKEDFRAFLEDSTVNLGRKTAKTRQMFIVKAMAMFDAFQYTKVELDQVAETCPSTNPMDNSVICIKPTNRNKALDVGKGVHAMTPGESMRADEQLNRSPFGNKSKKEGKENG